MAGPAAAQERQSAGHRRRRAGLSGPAVPGRGRRGHAGNRGRRRRGPQQSAAPGDPRRWRDVGRPKIESARDCHRRPEPAGGRGAASTLRLDASNALEIFAGYDLILDGADNFATRYLVNDAAAMLGQAVRVGVHLPLRRPGERVLGAARAQLPRPVPGGRRPPVRCRPAAEGGVFGMLCAAIGSIMVTEAVKLITGVGRTLLGRVMVFDALVRDLARNRHLQGPRGRAHHGTDGLRVLLRHAARIVAATATGPTPSRPPSACRQAGRPRRRDEETLNWSTSANRGNTTSSPSTVPV